MLHPQNQWMLLTCFIRLSLAWRIGGGKFRTNWFFPSLQSMRNTDCVKVQTIWIYTSKWSGCTTNMFVICLPSREKCLNIQRECFVSPVVNPHCPSPLGYLEGIHLVLLWLPLYKYNISLLLISYVYVHLCSLWCSAPLYLTQFNS